MANRNFNRFQALEKEVKALYAEISFNGAGVPTLVHGLGVDSVALNGGNIQITLQDKYMRLMSATVMELGAPSLTAPVAVIAEAVASSKTVLLSNADALASTSVLVRLDVKNSSV